MIGIVFSLSFLSHLAVYIYYSMKKILPLLILLTCMLEVRAVTLHIKTKNTDRKVRSWMCNGVEGGLFQLGLWQDPSFPNSGGSFVKPKMLPRFSYFMNTGADANYTLAKNFSVFTGVAIKNIGLIMKFDSIKYKHRVYTLGLPIGLRLHTANHKSWVKAGLDLSWALNYKKKIFEDEKAKIKYSEWFSSRVTSFMPSAFIGVSRSGITLSGHYYFNNFFNDKNASNLGYKANMITLGIGLNIDKKKGISKKGKNKEIENVDHTL